MLAIRAMRAAPQDPLSALEVGEVADPDPPAGWEVVEVRAASVNRHDLFTLQGVATPEEQLPVVLGSDAAGVTADGREVVCHAVVPKPGVDPVDESDVFGSMSILSEVYDGTHAERVAVPRRNLVDKPSWLSFAEAACLPTAWLTAYRALFVKAGLRPGQRLLVQGAGGGLATAAIVLGRAAGAVVYAASRDEGKRERAMELGAHAAVVPGERLPERVDVVLDSVGEATFGHSLRSLAAGGVVVVPGATTGRSPSAELHRVFARQLRVVGTSMGTRAELDELVRMLGATGARPVVDATFPLAEGARAYERLAAGDIVGKLVLTVG